MKKLMLSVSVVMAVLAFVACSKKGSDNTANPYGYYGNGNYGATPNDPRCGTGAYPGAYPNTYPGQYPQNVNCIPQNYISGGYPYYFQANYQVYLGMCDLRFAGRGQLCPAGYQCQPAFGSTGVCMRMY